MKSLKKSALFLALLVLLSVLALELFVIAEADHECVGEDCEICREIAVAENALKSFSQALALSALAFFAAVSSVGGRRMLSTGASSPTLVALKVKLSS